MGRFLRSAAGLFLAAVALRSASFLFDILNIDEVHFGLLGRSILDGGLPYVDAIDIKPPLTYLAFTAGGLFGGVSLLPVHLLGVPWLVATCLVLREAARRWTGSEDAGWGAAWIALLANLCEVPSVSAELLMNLPVALALLCAVRAEEERPRFDLLCGLCIGVASLFKHQAAMLGVGLGIALLWRGRNRAIRATLLLAGFLAPWAGTVAFYAAAGHLHEFASWVFLRNLLYAEKSGAGPALPRFALATLLCVGVAALPWVLAAQETLRRSESAREPMRTAVLISLWLTWLPVSAGGRFYEHYYLQFAPMLALAAAPRMAALLGRWRELPRVRRAAVTAGCCIPAAVYLAFTLAKGASGGFPGQDEKVVDVSRWLAANSRPDQRIFVWGDATSVYYLAQRAPGTRYLNCAVQVGNFDPSHLPRGFDIASHVSAPDVQATIADLERNRVGLVVDTSSAAIHHWDRLPLSGVAALASYVAAHYRLVATPGGVRVYARR
ncbi:MAG TPA: glycosyltransferase family 39 protein [Myxococcales bacterium]